MTAASDRLDVIQKRAEGLTDLCAEHLRQSIRHVQRNCDIDCNVHEDDEAWDACKQPDRYDGDRMALVLAEVPFLLDLARKQQAQLGGILALHTKICEVTGGECVQQDDCQALACNACHDPWPCPTVQALEAKP